MTFSFPWPAIPGALFFFALLAPAATHAQSDTVRQKKDMPTLEVRAGSRRAPEDYRGTDRRINDLVSTRLDVRPDFKKQHLYGKEWVTLVPHFYPTDTVMLDAKGMIIREVSLIRGRSMTPLKYHYDNLKLRVQLDRTYHRGQPYTLFISYVSRPNRYEAMNPGGSSAITSDKGLYFINADGKNPYKPTEVWTQGETQASSVWFPTIDEPDQKTAQQISITIPEPLTSLSNGRLVSQHRNPDGTRTDTWKMAHPNSPYLFMIAAGPFTVIRDHWKDVPVDYYVEKKYAPYAKAIFGRTPAMIDYFSKITGIPYPWTKYDQIVVRDYVSGAMENTTATLHGEFLYKTARQLTDDDYQNESVIAHELFHHWFGDLVTAESWSNLTVNESFADFSEMLWAEHAYGKDLAAQHSYQAMQQYFKYAKSGKDHPLVDFYYKDREDVFDYVTYQKGGRILNMLRDYVGDSAFFHSLHYYLSQHEFQPAEAQQLRLAFEHVTGMDLNWFWNQWYYGEGYPKLDIRYQYEDQLNLVHVIVRQTQRGSVFELPFAIDLYAGGKKDRHQVVMMDRTDTFTYHYAVRPDLVNVDGDKVLLAEKKDHKSIAAFIYQYAHAGLYMDRLEAIDACARVQDSDSAARSLLIKALQDPFQGIRSHAVEALDMKNATIRGMMETRLRKLISTDAYSSVRSAALSALAGNDPSGYRADILAALQDSSLRVEATALDMLQQLDAGAAYDKARELESSAEAPLSQTVCSVLAYRLDSADYPYIKKNFRENGSFDKFGFVRPFLHMLAGAVTDSAEVRQGLDETGNFALQIGTRYGAYVIGMLQDFIEEKQHVTDQTSDVVLKSRLSAQVAYAQQLLRHLQQTLSP